jgi:ABC-type dipeptide/oligopeptide/nickel transport system permease component
MTTTIRRRAAGAFRPEGYGIYVAQRLLGFIPLLLGLTVITFTLVRLLPGDPAQALAGNTPYGGVVESLRHRMGLDRSIPEQYLIYLRNLVHGDLGDSWVTGKTVVSDLLLRAPATLELITYSLILSVLVGVALGATGALKPGTLIDRAGQVYSSLAGAIPDFWMALLVIFVLFHLLGVIPPPLTRLPLALSPPPAVTGFYTVDALIAGDGGLFVAALKQLIGPVLTLGLLNAPLISKFTRATMEDILRSEFISFARGCGLPARTIAWYAFRNAVPPVVTISGFVYTFLLGGAVLVETVFSWNGIGSYAVQSVVNRDYAPIQGFVLIAGLFSLVVYLVVDLLYMVADPRIRLRGSGGRP